MLGILGGAVSMWLLLRYRRSTVLVLICCVAIIVTAGPANIKLGIIYKWIYYGIIGFTTIVVSCKLLTIPSKTLFGKLWRIFSTAERATALILILFVLFSTMVSMITNRKSSGGAFIVFSVFVALSESWHSACRRKGNKLQTLQPLILINICMIVVGLIASWLGPRGGNSGNLLSSSGSLAMFSAATLGGAFIFGGQRKQMRFAGVVLVSMALFILVTQYSDKSSLIVAVLVSWIVIAVMSHLRLHYVNKRTRGQREIATIMAIIILLTCIIPAILTYFLYSGSLQSEKIASFVSWVTTRFGETNKNLFDRPARWSVLLIFIVKHPINLVLTNFEEFAYRVSPFIWRSAQPHNVLIAFGIWWGWIGLLVILLFVWLFFRRAAACFLLADKDDKVVAFWAIGVTSGLFFRNMWSIGILTFPMETFLFASAVCLIALIDTRRASSYADSTVETSRTEV
jgi:hypothetical protein